MIGLLCFVVAVLALPFKSKLRLQAENAVLRHQLNVLRRRPHGRLRLTNKFAGSSSSLYEGLACQEGFSRSTFLLFLRFERGSRERSSALMARPALCLAALSGHPPEPGGARRKARGVDGGSARRATIRPGHYDVANVRFVLILFLFSSFVR